VWNCVRDSSVCSKKNWLKIRYEECLRTETRKDKGKKDASRFEHMTKDLEEGLMVTNDRIQGEIIKNLTLRIKEMAD